MQLKYWRVYYATNALWVRINKNNSPRKTQKTQKFKSFFRGFLEAVYQECLAKELANRNIPFVEQQALKLYYKNQTLRQAYIPDFICHQSIIIELKASNIRLGLLINFGCYQKPLLNE